MKKLLLVLITLNLFVGSSALDAQVRSFTKVWDGGVGGFDPDGIGPLPSNLIRAWGVIGRISSGPIDIDKNGKNEFISYDATGQRIIVWETTGDNDYDVVWHKDKYNAQGQSTLFGVERSVMITDLDGDGNLELINIWDSFDPDVTNGFNALEVYEHDPTSGDYLPDVPILTYDPPRMDGQLIRLEFMSVATDVDGDGVVELILTHRGGRNILLSIISLPGMDFQFIWVSSIKLTSI